MRSSPRVCTLALFIIVIDDHLQATHNSLPDNIFKPLYFTSTGFSLCFMFVHLIRYYFPLASCRTKTVECTWRNFACTCMHRCVVNFTAPIVHPNPSPMCEFSSLPLLKAAACKVAEHALRATRVKGTVNCFAHAANSSLNLHVLR